MIEPFISINGKSIYFYPGVDDFGRVVAKLDFVDKNANYKFAKYEDRSIEYVMQDPSIEEVGVIITDVLRHEITKRTLQLEH